jgi:gamma-glutamylcyclotransferase (GGCT)/AIG2-like uncharacterized protein YtfP
MAAEPEYLFVYGTLRPGSAHLMAGFLAARARHLGPARAPGRLYDLGPYPGMVGPAADGDWVRGDLYELPQAQATLVALDRYEGYSVGREAECLFARGRTEAALEAGGRFRAWVYLYAGPLPEGRRIASGDYLKGR